MPTCNKTKTNLTPYGINPVPESTQIVLALSRTKVRMDTKINDNVFLYRFAYVFSHFNAKDFCIFLDSTLSIIRTVHSQSSALSGTGALIPTIQNTVPTSTAYGNNVTTTYDQYCKCESYRITILKTQQITNRWLTIVPDSAELSLYCIIARYCGKSSLRQNNLGFSHVFFFSLIICKKHNDSGWIKVDLFYENIWVFIRVQRRIQRCSEQRIESRSFQ